MKGEGPMHRARLRWGVSIVVACLLAVTASPAWSGAKKPDKDPAVFPPDSKPYGKSYSEWAAAFWQWAFALPVEGHPFLDTDPQFDFGRRQTGRVWFWSAPDGPL